MKYFVSLALLLNCFYSPAVASLIEEPAYYQKSRAILCRVKEKLNECHTLALAAQNGYLTDAAQRYFRQHLIAIEQLNGKLHNFTAHTCPMDFHVATMNPTSTGQRFSERTHGLIAGKVESLELIKLDETLTQVRLTLKSLTSTKQTCLHGVFNHKQPDTYLDLMAENSSRLSLSLPHDNTPLMHRIETALKANTTTPVHVIKSYKPSKSIKSIMHTARLKGGYYCVTYTPWIDDDIYGFFTVQNFNSRKIFTIKKGIPRKCKKISLGIDLMLQLHPKFSFNEPRQLGQVVFYVKSPAAQDELFLWSQYKAEAFYINFSLKELCLSQLTITLPKNATSALRQIENALKILNDKEIEINTLSQAFPPSRNNAVTNIVDLNEHSDLYTDDEDCNYLSWPSYENSI